MKVRAAWLFVVVGVTLSSQGELAAQSPRQVTSAPVTDAMLRDPAPGDWLMPRRTYEGRSYSALDQIDRSNIRDLELVWAWGLEKQAIGVDDQIGPIVHDGIMYLALTGGVAQALDAATGDLIWEYRHAVMSGLERRSGGIRGGLVLYDDKVYLHPPDGKIVAINARDGSLAWETVLFDPADGYGVSSTGLAVNGKIISGVRCSRFNGNRCFISAHDATNGELLWKRFTTTVPGEPGGDTWGDLSPIFRSGGDPWITGTYDPELNLTCWGVAQAKPWHRVTRGTGDASTLYTSSTLALNPDTGEIVWYYQYIPGESLDLDEHFAFINVDVDGRKSGFMMGKTGVLWHVDRVTGELIRAHDTGLQEVVEIDPEKGFVRYLPGVLKPSGVPSYTCPSTSGFKSVREMGYNPATQAFYIPMSLNCSDRTFSKVELVAGEGSNPGNSDRINYYHPDHPGLLGQLLAMDVHGNKLWTYQQRAQFGSSLLTTAGGLAFVGDVDRYVRAFDIETGEVLWRQRLTTKVSGFPISYQVGGRQYLAFITGLDSHNWISTVTRDLNPEIVWPRAGTAVFVYALRED